MTKGEMMGQPDGSEMEKVKVFTMPPLQREQFPDDETYAAALASQQRVLRTDEVDDDEIDITGLDKVTLLQALYHNGQQVGLGLLSPGMTNEQIAEHCAKMVEDYGEFPYVDYLGGKPLKCNLSGDVWNARLFDRDNGGSGTGRRIVEAMRADLEANAS